MDDGWEPYRIDERKLNDVLAWIVEHFGPVRVDVDVDQELQAAQSMGRYAEDVEQEIWECAERHLDALERRRREEADTATRSQLPPEPRRAVDTIRGQLDAIVPRRLSADAEARRAFVLEKALAEGTEQDLQDACRLVWATERAEARHDRRECHSFFREFGPLLAAPATEQKFEAVNLPQREVIPVPPWPPNLPQTIDEFRQIRQGLLILHAIRSGEMERIPDLASELRAAKADGVSPSTLRAMVEADAVRFGSPGGDLGFVLKWFVHMATRWLFQVWPDQESGGLLLPVPVGLSQLIWMVLGHNAGAFRLPFEHPTNLGIRFCAECGRTIFSSQPRKRGRRWFCDPPPGKERSVCANRYFSRASKKKKRESADTSCGAGG